MALTALHRRIISGRKKLSAFGITPSLSAYSALAIVCILALAASAISQAAATANAARISARQIQAFAVIVDAASFISAERGPANTYMSSGLSTVHEAEERWMAARQRTDAALTAAIEVGISIRSIEDVRNQLAAGRKLVTMVAQTPKDHRRSIDIEFAINTMFRAWDLYHTQVVVHKGLDIIAIAPGLSAVILQGTALSDIREYAGRIGSYLIGAMTTQERISAENVQKIQLLRGKIDDSWRFVAPAIMGGGGDSSVRQKAVDVQRAFFGAGIQLVNTELARNLEEASFSMDAATFTDRYVQLLTPLTQLRNSYLKQLVATYETGKQHAIRALLCNTIITFILLTLVLGILFKVRNRLVRPLLEGVEDVVALADGRHVETRSGRNQIYEINKLFKAIAVLRMRLEERAELTRQLAQLAETDQLTGLFNRRGFERRALEANASRSTQLIVLDIDHFKAVNDQHGHPVGDKLLKQVAEMMTAVAGEDTVIGRMGGEEFAILCEGRPAVSAVHLARRLRRHLQHQTLSITDKTSLKITASFGVSVDPGLTLGEHMKRADDALYRAKAQGRNRVRIGRLHRRPQPIHAPERSKSRILPPAA